MDEGRLHAYLDGELRVHDAAAADALEAHVAECDACAERLADAQALRAETAGMLADAAPGAVAGPSFEELRGRAAARREGGADAGGSADAGERARWSRIQRYAWAASLAGALIIGWYAREAVAPPAEQAVPAQVEADAVSPANFEADAPSSQTSASGAEPVPASAPTPSPAAPPASRTAPAPATPAPDASQAAPVPDDRGVIAEGSEPREEEARTAERARLGAGGVQLEALVVQDARADSAGESVDAGGFVLWQLASATELEATLGRPALVVAGMDIVDLAVAADGSDSVRVRQRLAGGGVLELVQSRGPRMSSVTSAAFRRGADVLPVAPPAPRPSSPTPDRESAAAAKADASESSVATDVIAIDSVGTQDGAMRAISIDGVIVAARADLSADSLRALLTRLIPLRDQNEK